MYRHLHYYGAAGCASSIFQDGSQLNIYHARLINDSEKIVFHRRNPTLSPSFRLNSERFHRIRYPFINLPKSFPPFRLSESFPTNLLKEVSKESKKRGQI